jgi:serine/threonine protein kinase
MAFTLKDYSSLKELGHGGMSVVYTAVQKSLGREVVIKKMVAHLAADVTLQKRFENEAKSAASLDHDNIIKIYDFGTDKDAFYICMEYVNGPSFDVLIKEPYYPREIGLMIMLQAMQGLEHAHKKGIIHRDIKPGNILVSNTGHVKVLDFGLAYAGESTHITVGDAVLGSPLYMSPEQAKGGWHKDIRMDIFSVGVLLYRILSGEFPFSGENIPALLLQIVHKKEKDIREMAPAFPDDLIKYISQCLEKDINRRLTSLMPLIESLHNYFFEIGVRDIVQEISKYIYSHEARISYENKLIFEYRLKQGKLSAAAGKLKYARAHLNEALRYDPSNGKVLGEKSSSFQKKVFRLSLVGVIAIIAIAIGFTILPEKEKESKPMSRKDSIIAAVEDSSIPVREPVVVAKRSEVKTKEQPSLPAKRKTVVQKKIPDKIPLEPEISPPVADSPPAITTPEKKPVNQEAVGDGFLHVFSRPWADLYIDGRRYGTTPTKTPIVLPSGMHTIKCKRSGFVTYIRKIKIKKSETTRLRIELRSR